MNTTRRELLKVGLGGLAVVSLGGTIPAFLTSFARADAAQDPAVANDNILVVVQMSGGNDGLNCVIPAGNDAYYKNRPVLGIKPQLQLKLKDGFALNPGMGAFKDLYDAGKLAVINGCGYPQPSRSHFRSMEIWQTANPKESVPGGWLGHYLDHCLRGTDSTLRAINIGGQAPQALVTEGAPTPSISSIEDFGVKTDPADPAAAKRAKQIIAELNAVRASTPALQFLSRQATNAIVSADEVRKLTAGYKPDAAYPPGIGQQLKLIAQIIAGNFGTKLFYCEIGGFDTHANQLGGHEQQLRSMSASIAAFHKDLGVKGYDDKVTVMCFSEFGRRVRENGSAGTDHGAAGPMFVSGGKVKGGIYGEYPSLADLDDGDLKHTTDFRRVYATLLDTWLNADSATVLGNKFEPIGFV